MPGGSFVRVALVVLLALALAACGGRKTRPGSVPQPLGEGAPARVTPLAAGEDPCAVVLQHDERWYTPGGLYAPHIRDGRPSVQLDVSNLPEPVPQLEPLSRYGNRSPYTVLGKSYTVMDERARSRYRERGIASWYGTKFHGRQTSSLEPYDMCQFSAAHKSLPLPSYALVTNLENGKDVIVRVNDRGPFHEGRVIDLSYAAALRIGVYARGTAQVEVQAIDPNDRRWQRFLAARGVGAPAASPRRAPAAAPPAATPPVQPPPTAVAAAPALPPPATASAVDLSPAAEIAELPPAPLPSPAPPAPPLPQVPAGATAWLQVGSFAERANADTAARRLREAGLGGIEIAPVDVAGRAYWRVRLGPLAADAAAEAAARVTALGLGQPRVALD